VHQAGGLAHDLGAVVLVISVLVSDVIGALTVAYDPAGITALLAANVAHEFLSLIALNKKRAVRSAP
jgi:hypothetical protein